MVLAVVDAAADILHDADGAVAVAEGWNNDVVAVVAAVDNDVDPVKQAVVVHTWSGPGYSTRSQHSPQQWLVVQELEWESEVLHT